MKFLLSFQAWSNVDNTSYPGDGPPFTRFQSQVRYCSESSGKLKRTPEKRHCRDPRSNPSLFEFLPCRFDVLFQPRMYCTRSLYRRTLFTFRNLQFSLIFHSLLPFLKHFSAKKTYHKVFSGVVNAYYK